MNRQHRTGSRALMILVFLFLYAPILILIVFSFNEGNSNAVWQGFSLRWYEALFHNKKMMEAVSNTLLIAILATVISTIAGTFAAIGLFNNLANILVLLLANAIVKKTTDTGLF